MSPPLESSTLNLSCCEARVTLVSRAVVQFSQDTVSSLGRTLCLTELCASHGRSGARPAFKMKLPGSQATRGLPGTVPKHQLETKVECPWLADLTA